MADLGATLGRRYGPLPLYAWAGLALLGFLLYRHLGARIPAGISALTSSPADPSASPITAGDNSGGGGSASSGGAGMTVPPDPTTIVADTAPADAAPTGASVSFSPAPSSSFVSGGPYNYGGGPYSAPPPSSVYVNPSTGTVSVIPSGTVTAGGGITGRGVQGGL